MSILNMIRRVVSLAVVFLAVAAFPPVRASAQCLDQWRPIFGVPPGPDGQVQSVTVWDPDGPGPLSAQPVIGGGFQNVGGVFTRGIIRFDGNMWLPFVSNGTVGLDGVRALTTWDPDGPGPEIAQLVAGGDFVAPGTLNHIARWDGTAWQPFADGFSGSTSVYSLATWDPDGSGPLSPRLVAGGNFTTTPGGTTVNRVAWWDGAAWQPLGTGFVNGTTFALTVYDPDGSGPLGTRLVAGGNWTLSGSTPVNRAAWWDGAAWQPFAAGFDNSVVGLTTWDPDGSGPQFEQVVATGAFLMSGTTAVQFIARWDGSAWQPLGAGVGSSSFCVSTWDPDADGPMPPEVVAGGSFTFAGGPGRNRVARWNGTTWQGFGTGIGAASVLALANWDPDGAGPLSASPLAVGSFLSAGSHTVNYVARWQDDGQNSDWEPLGMGLSGFPMVVTSVVNWDSDGGGPAPAQLVAGGTFTVGSGNLVNKVARWDGGEWQPLAGGVSNNVYGLTTWDPDGGGPLPDELVAVGDFTTAGGTTANHVARFDGTQWQAFGIGVNGSPQAVTTWDLDGPGGDPAKIVVGGSFTGAGGNPVNFVALWDGSAWQPMGTGFINHVHALTAWSHTGDPADTMVYAGGVFGGTPNLNYIARWNGAAWEDVDHGTTLYVEAFTTWSPAGGPERLIVGGSFFQVVSPPPTGAQTANRIAGFGGSHWDAFFEPGFNNGLSALTTWDPDGSGPLLPRIVAGGPFTSTTSGSFPVLNGVAHWDGDSWEPFGVGLTGGAVAFTEWDPDGTGPADSMLAAAGTITLAGGLPGGYIAALIAHGPIIVSDPQSPAPAPVGSQVALNVSAVGGSPALTFRWHKDGVPLTDGPTGSGSTILGATLATLTISNVSAADAGDYDCELANACSGVTSAAATLSVSGGCPGDLNGDQQVDLLDFAEFQVNFGTSSGATYADGDLDGDGDVDLADLGLLLAELGSVCP